MGSRLTRRALLLLAAGAGASRAEIDRGSLAFPRDFGSHNDAHIEWWYATGELHVERGDELCGFQITFFRSRTDLARDNPSRFAARQVLIAHAALSDLRAGQMRHAQRMARWSEREDESLVAFASVRDTRLRIGDWTLLRDAQGYHTAFDDRGAGFACALVLRPTQPLLLQGVDGVSRKGPAAENISRYYSEPQLAVSGTLARAGTPVPVQGRAWLDHEWSDAYLPQEAVGWDWIGMNLLDGGTLMAFRLRRADGSALYAGGSSREAGAATARNFRSDELHFEPGRRWTSPATRASYPVEWLLQSPAGTHVVRARMDAQELDGRGMAGAVYWEGLADLLDAQGHLVGRGYLEMTGYAGRLAL
jgi:predicted secreted hydrolase